MAKILIIDDEEQLRRLMARIIGLEGYEVAEAPDCASGMKTLRRYDPDVVLCDVKLPDGNGVEMVGRIKEAAPATEVILLTAYGNIPDGVQAIKNGAFDYITKGDDNNKILPLLSRAAERRNAAAADPHREQARRALPLRPDRRRLGGHAGPWTWPARSPSPASIAAHRRDGNRQRSSRRPSTTPAAARSFRGDQLLGAFSRNCSKSELFGHRAGSFTSAIKDKKGLSRKADKGTLFLDEIGEMPVELQSKLLRVLESGEFIKVGETRPTRVDVRLIAATNRNLEKEIAAGNFREDLYFRLSVFRIHLPSLRERPGDIAGYIRVFAAQFADKMGRRIDSIDADYIAALERHTWHGNVRELRNAVERSMIMADGNRLTADCLAPEFHAAAGSADPDSLALDDLERRHILRVLEHTRGNKAEAARLLGIGIATLYRKLDGYGVK